MKTIKSILLAQLEDNKADLKSHETLKALLTPYDGKPFDKRLMNKLPGYELNIQYGLIHIISPTGQKHFLGWMGNNETNTVNVSKFDTVTDTAYYVGSKERIEKLESFLNDETRFKQLVSLFNKVNKAWKTFYKAAKELEYSKMESYHNPAYYDLLRNFGVPSEVISDIRFDKFKFD
jgi:hypothetical protein